MSRLQHINKVIGDMNHSMKKILDKDAKEFKVYLELKDEQVEVPRVDQVKRTAISFKNSL